jgi:hypothetical protein
MTFKNPIDDFISFSSLKGINFNLGPSLGGGGGREGEREGERERERFCPNFIAGKMQVGSLMAELT